MAGSEQNVAHLRAIGQLCADAGLRVLEAGGWTTRGRDWGILVPEYAVCHHTAAPVDVDRLLIEGRADLQGPLANIALHADGTVVLIASGTANHAGVATISSAQAWGIEATGPIPTGNTGVDAFPNYDAYLTLCAAIRIHHGWPPDRVVGHKEIARPDGRKIDPAFGSTAPAPYEDMARFRAQVDQRVQTWGQEDDVTEEQARQLEAVYKGLIVPGTTTPDQTVDLMFARIRTLEAAVQPTANALAQLGAQVAELTQLVKGISLGKLEGDVEFTGLAHLQTPPPPPFQIPPPPP